MSVPTLASPRASSKRSPLSSPQAILDLMICDSYEYTYRLPISTCSHYYSHSTINKLLVSAKHKQGVENSGTAILFIHHNKLCHKKVLMYVQ